MILRVTRHAYGPRVYLAGRRVHHGPAALAVAALAAARGRRAVAALAILAAAHDARDFPWRDCDNHAPRARGRW